ncbi:monovalent cation/H+ antiporter complex subunit F [Spirochaeta africana]|uniref:Multisubunit Na+/H+ antiporter, MnhF subunit n=1 Tax=Spirochaeta africana (strain ATCC 700263 / DSM 8902 / Z-7692) TaxID=889378 RepID=H9ULG1_SPIAZ|nr:monovalent cation/H+ antiporter complex subunit F [Spirochaeta africana]AFG38354.1 multisubunit Na+/H+ antiporter, MnhF subunit [Spirochaeta africana DSM 8902]
MITWTITLLAAFSMLCLIRVLRGPTLLDRIAAADAIGLMMTVILVLLGVLLERTIFLDIAIVYGLLLFADLLVITKYLEQGRH